jgi:ribose transport system substrate-binding protein
MKIVNPRAAAGMLTCAVIGLSVGACGSSSNGSSGSGSSSSSGSPPSAAASGTGSTPAIAAATATPASGLAAKLPAALASQYVGFPTAPTASTYANFAAVKGPWKVCYSESYQGNPSRVALANGVKALAAQYEKAGLVSSFTMSVSNNDVVRQSEQIRQFVQQGCSVIFSVAGSATGLNAAIQYAYQKGVPFVTMWGSVTSPYAVNVDSNYYVLGEELAKATGQAGNVLMVKGIAGEPIASIENSGATKQWSSTGTTAVDQVYGNWTPSTTKSAVLNALTTHPGNINAVWSTGSEAAEIAQAFTQAGRKPPLITASISGDALGYWKAHPDFRFAGVNIAPSWTAETGWRVGMRTLAGEGPKIDPILVPIPTVSQSDLASLYKPCMTPTSSSVFPVSATDPLPENLMDTYFTKKGEVGPYSYAKTPDPCGTSS